MTSRRFASNIHWHDETLLLAADAIISRFCSPPEQQLTQKRKSKYRRYNERPCSKKRHKTAQGARRHIRLLVEAGSARKNEMNFYRCKDCGYIHVGHINEEAKVQKEGKRKRPKYREID